MHPEATPMEGDLHEAVSVFVQLRPRLFGIAYRVLGSAAEAEDVVQEVWLRWQHTTTDRRRQPRRLPVERHHPTGHSTWPSRPGPPRDLTSVRGCPNPSTPATTRRPVPNGRKRWNSPCSWCWRSSRRPSAPPTSCGRPSTTPIRTSRGSWGSSPVNVRKIVSRARKHLTEDQRDSVDAVEHRRLLDAFVTAARHGDIASLESLLTSDARSASPTATAGAGAARVPVIGRTRVANLSTAFPRFWPTVEVETVEANGRAGVVLYRDGRPATFMTVAATRRGIHQVMWVFSPNKMAALLRSREGSGAGAGADSGAGAGLREVVFSTV